MARSRDASTVVEMEQDIIFCPLDLQDNGYIFGWRLSRHILCVAGVISCASHVQAQSLLEEALEGKEWKELATPGTKPCILSQSRLPAKAFVREETGTDSKIVIFYHLQDRAYMRFYTIQPLELDITRDAKQDIDQLSRCARLLSHSDFAARSSLKTLPSYSIPIDQMNLAHELNYLVHRLLTRQRISHVSREQKFASLLRTQLFDYIFIYTKGLRELCISILRGLCNLPIPAVSLKGTRLKDLSASVQQIDVRLEQGIFLPKQFRLLQNRNKSNVAFSAAHYISFYNCIWLVLNDAIVGTAFGTFLVENSDYLGNLLYRKMLFLTVHVIQKSLVWLDHWPAGLKLNTELSRFLCVCFMSLTDLWGHGLDLLAPNFPIMLTVIGVMGRMGMTMILSLFSDLLSFLTGHLYLSYLLATAIFSCQLSVGYSLWNLFRGKRRNVLRNRIDSWDYDIDQLLLGTILFTLVALLFPTVLVYYVLFALARLITLLIHATFETMMAFMNHFPLFAMMLRLKDPSRLPGGIYFVADNPFGTLTIQPSHGFFSNIFLFGLACLLITILFVYCVASSQGPH